MRICHIAHGKRQIPPPGWGAVESLIWDYKYFVESFGHLFYIVNTPDAREVMQQVNSIAPDVVHAHCERHFHVLDHLNPSTKVRIISSHWPQLYEDKRRLKAIALSTVGSHICCLSDRTQQYLLDIEVEPERIFIAKNGARADLFRFTEKPHCSKRSVCVGTIDKRKRQHLIQDLDFVDFIGPRRDPEFDYSKNYLGEWPKEKLHWCLTDYANLVLLSCSEVAPLVTCEALMAGLGLVVSESAAANLDLTRPFITVIPERRMSDKDYVLRVIRENQEISVSMRQMIRDYAVSNFDWKCLVQQYIQNLERLCVSSS